MEILVFELAGQRFGIRSMNALEVLRAATLTDSPTAPEAIEGLLNLRGRIVPVLDLRQTLNLPAQEMRHVDHLIVLQAAEHEIAIRVDRAIDLMELRTDSEQGASMPSATHLVAWVGKTSDGLIHVLDTARLLFQEDVASFVVSFSQRTATELTA